MPNLQNGTKVGFEPELTRLRVRRSTTELRRSTSSTVSKSSQIKVTSANYRPFLSGGSSCPSPSPLLVSSALSSPHSAAQTVYVPVTSPPSSALAMLGPSE